MSRGFQALTANNRIRQWFAAPYTHSQAAGIENDMRVIGESAIVVIRSSRFPLCMWHVAFNQEVALCLLVLCVVL
jgi:hypothetical protein